MQPFKAETIEPDLSPAYWMAIALIVYGVFYFANGLVSEHMHVGDGADNLVMFLINSPVCNEGSTRCGIP